MRLSLSGLHAGAWSSSARAAGQSILGNGLRSIGINAIETALGAAYFAVIARYLGPNLYGHWAYGVASYTLVMGLVGSFDILMLLHLGRDKRNADAFVGLTLMLRVALLGLGGLALAAYGIAAEPKGLTSLVLFLLIPALVGRGVALWARTCFLAYERMAAYMRLAALFRTAEAGCGIAYVCAGGGLLGVVCLHSLLWLGESGFGLWRVRSRLTDFALRFDWHSANQLLRQGTILGLATAASAWLTAGPIMLLRQSGIGMAQLGQFAIMSSLTMILVGSAEAFFCSALPVLSRSARRADAGMVYGRAAALAIVAGALAAAAAGWVLGPPIVDWALGVGYRAAGSLLAPFLLIGGAILSPIGYFHMLLVSGRRWPEAVANVSAGLWLAVALVPAAEVWDLNGAVLATGGAWLIRAAILIGWGESDRARASIGHAIAAAHSAGKQHPF